MNGGKVIVPKEIVLEWIKGDPSAFGRIVKMTMKQAYAVALSFVGNADDAKDISQEAFIHAHRARSRYDPDREFFPWLYTIIRNLCLNFLKKRKVQTNLSLDALELKPSRDPNPQEQVIVSEKREMVWKALFELTPEHREVIILKDINGYSYAEIAGILDVPIGTVMSRLYYAREKLYEVLKEFKSI